MRQGIKKVSLPKKKDAVQKGTLTPLKAGAEPPFGHMQAAEGADCESGGDCGQ